MYLHQNSVWLMNWADRMIAKYGQPKTGLEWCRKLAYSVGEAGQDHPSDDAIRTAIEWENELNEESEGK